jgi:hypothetical protein
MALIADLVTGLIVANGVVVEVLDVVAGTLGADAPTGATPVAGIETRLSLPALSVPVVPVSVVEEVVCCGSVAPRVVVCAGRLASFRGSGRGAGVDGATAVGGKLVAGSSGRRSDACRWIKL